MSELRKLGEGEKFSHATVGAINGFNGKVFIKDELKETSCEISFGTLEPGQAVPFFHSHKANEENYIILSGEGSFQVNSDVFSIAEGSIIPPIATAPPGTPQKPPASSISASRPKKGVSTATQ